MSFLTLLELLAFSCLVSGYTDTAEASIRTREDASAIAMVAATPPRGWNSYDCYSNPNETQILSTANAMSKYLSASGYEYVVLDAGWYRTTSDAQERQDFVIDAYGRLQPDPARFPSSANNAGFASLSGQLSTLGLKLGIHVMRGISTAAINANTPVLGTHGQIFARDIVNMSAVCPWWNDFYALNMSADGAQQYIESLYSQYIQDWRIAFIKNDCIFGGDYDRAEIECVSNAINSNTAAEGDHVVYSLSPGNVAIGPSQMAQEIHDYVNMYRITGDNWDYYKDVLRPFNISAQYASAGLYNGSGLNGRSWPDLDMLPFGDILSHNQRNGPDTHSALSFAEQRCEMTLWCMVRSPLIFGGLVTEFDNAQTNAFVNFTLQLLTNADALNVNSLSDHNAQVSIAYNQTGYPTQAVWYSDILARSQYFVAMFNLQMANNFESNVSLSALPLSAYKFTQCELYDIWNEEMIGKTSNGYIVQQVPFHDVRFLRLDHCQ